MSRSRFLLLATIVSLLMSRPSWPRPAGVTVEMLGIVDAVDDPTHILDGSVVVGTAIRALYRVSLNASPEPFSQPNSADYWGAIRRGAQAPY
jgi:hypothetical protein